MTWMLGGHNDWFSVMVGETDLHLRINHRASTLYQNFDDAADQAASLLYQQWGHRPLYLALSGGMDSELTARILLKNKIPFTPVILKIADLNALETWYAEYWCSKNKIAPVILHYSVDEFAQAMMRLSPKLQQIKNCYQTPTLLIYEYAQQFGGSCIYSGGDINLDPDCKKFYCHSLDFISNLVDPGLHPTSFFMYTPEIALSYINQFDTEQDEQYNKINFYQVLPRPKIDYIKAIENTKKLQDIKDKIFYIFKITGYKQKYWYGTKEQLIQNLQP
jgi:hypothetical protein